MSFSIVLFLSPDRPLLCLAYCGGTILNFSSISLWTLIKRNSRESSGQSRICLHLDMGTDGCAINWEKWLAMPLPIVWHNILSRWNTVLEKLHVTAKALTVTPSQLLPTGDLTPRWCSPYSLNWLVSTSFEKHHAMSGNYLITPKHCWDWNLNRLFTFL